MSDSGTIVALHESGRRWRAVAGEIRAGKLSFLDAQTFSAGENERMGAWIREQDADQVLALLPAACVVCRNCTLPAATPGQLEAALEIQSELHLQSIAPPHRRGAAVLDAAPGESARSGLLLAWPQSAEYAAPELGFDVDYVPDIASIAALLDGERPVDPMLFVDRRSGAVAGAIAHSGGASFRSTREDAGQVDEWRDGIRRVIAETALGVGHTGEFIDSMVQSIDRLVRGVGPDEAELFLPDEVRQSAVGRFSAAPREREWWSEYGIAAGALLARTTALIGLTGFQQEVPEEHPSIAERLTRRFATPAFAWRAAVLAIVLLGLAPLVFSGLRLIGLQMRYGDLSEEVRAVNALKMSREMYRELDSEAWPMTKLLSDIVCTIPQGVDVDNIRLSLGQDLSIQGRARKDSAKNIEAQDQVTKLHQNLLATGIFTEVDYGWGDRDNFGNLEFNVTARVTKPHATPDLKSMDLDYADRTLAQRLYGDDVVSDGTGTRRTTPTASAPDTGEPVSSPPDTALARTDINTTPEPRPGENLTADGGTSGSPPRTPNRFTGLDGNDTRLPPATEGGPSSVPPSQKIPGPYTKEQIDAMSVDEARALMVEYAAARRQNHPEEIATRLKNEWDMIMERIKRG